MDDKTWKASRRKYGVAILNYSASSKGSLCLTVGDAVHIVEEYGSGQTGWFRGHLFSNRNKVGIFPIMYIHTKDFEVENAGQFETVTSKEDPMANELRFTLREWWEEWKKSYHNNGHTLALDKIYSTMNDMILMRGKLLSNMLTDESMIDLKEEIAGIVDWGNVQLGMDLIPRVDGKQVDVEKCSIVKLYRVHLQSALNAKSLQPTICNRALSRNWGARRPSSAQIERRSKDNADVFNVLVNFQSSQCNVGDESQIIMSVYDSRNHEFISEQFEIRMNRNGAPVRAEKINNCYGLFTELSLDSNDKYLYIVIKIYRIGRMLIDGPKSKKPGSLRRPFGVGVLSIEDVKSSLKEGSYLCTVNITSCADNEGNFGDLHKDVIKKQTNQGLGSSTNSVSGGSKGGYSTTPTKQGTGAGMSLTVDVSMFYGDLQTVKTEQPLLFQKDIIIVPKLSQFDIINPGEVRNDIYLTLVEGVYEKGSKTAQKNIEVVVTAFNSDGGMIESCIYHGCGEAPVNSFSSSVSYHNNNPKWKETIKISLPMNELPDSLIRFDVYHCQARNRAVKKLYGFGFMKVTNDLQIVIKDGTHRLSVFKCTDEKKIKFEKYSRLSFLVDDYETSKQSGPQSSTTIAYERHKDYLVVNTLLCSTKFTQTTELLGVLNWKQERKQIDRNLDKLMTVQGTEIMKFLQSIMDRLLEMLDDGCSTKATYSSKVFQVIIFMLNLLLDVRFENFRPVYEDYLLKSFSFPNVYIHLMTQFSAGISMFCAGQPFTLSMAMKVLGELMRIITRSRQLEKASPFYRKESEIEFKMRLHQIFENMGKLLSIQEDRLKISQMELLSNLHECYVPLMELITKRELADQVRDVIIQLPKAKDLVVEIRRTKMEFIQKTVNSDLFKDDESRGTLLPLCLNHIKACLIERYFLDVEISISILGDILEILFNLQETKNITQDINTLALSLFAVLIQSISRMTDGDLMSNQQSHPQSFHQIMLRKPSVSDNSNPYSTLDRNSSRSPFQRMNRPSSEVIPTKDEPKLLGEMVACLIELLRLMEESHYTAIIQIYPKGRPLKEFLTLVFLTFQELIKPEMLSSDWTIMRMEANNVIFSAVEYFSQALKNEFLEGECFDQHLWNLYFNLAVEFIVQPSLQLEEYTDSKRNKFIESYHDMRVMMGHQIQTLWEKLGSNRRHFIPSMIGPFLKVTLVPEKELRVATLPIFYDMIQCEQNTSGNFVMVEREIIEKLDMFITMDNQGDNEYKELFQSILLERVQSEPALKDTGSQFIVSVTNLLEKLLDYKQVYDGDENRDKRMQCTFNILNFYRDNKDKRREMYTQYIKKLYDLHCKSKNFVEAGLSLQLYVQLLEWKNDDIHSEMGFRQEPQCERKEKLLLEIIECFDKGKIWEYGIPVCKDLAAYYESQLMYRKLSKILEKEASFFRKILDGVELPNVGLDQPKFYPRQEPTYFKVAYYGMSFPPFVQNKAFIYRGGECLKLQDIINQLTQEYPGAEILKSNNPMEENKMCGEAKYIQISGVKPIPNPKNSFADELKVPREVAKFFENNDVDTFQFNRSFHQGKKDPDNEFKTLCTERTIMKTNHKFPGILQWYEVVESEISIFSPVSTAINAVNSACSDLEVSIETSRRSCSDNNIKDLSRQLNGMITAQVMGGIPKYQEAFFTEEFRSSRPEELRNIQILKDKINLQVNLLDQGLDVMKKDNSEGLKLLVDSLNVELHKLKKQIGYCNQQRKATLRDHEKKIDSGICSLIDPRPGTPSSQHSGGSCTSSMISSETRSIETDELINLIPTKSRPDTLNRPDLSKIQNPKGIPVSQNRGPPNKPPKPQIHDRKKPEDVELKPSIPPKHKPSTEPKISKLSGKDEGFSVVKTAVPPLPPRRPSFRDSMLPPDKETNSNESPTPLPRINNLSDSSGETEFSPGTSSKFETPPIIPSHSTPRVSKIQLGTTSTECDMPLNSSYNKSGPSVLRNKTTHNGNVPAIPVSSQTNNSSKSASDEIRNGPPPIPARTSRLSSISQTSNSSHGSGDFYSSDL